MFSIRATAILIATVLIIGFVKFILHPSSAGSDIINIALTVASILFGLLAGFFISMLWGRYSEIRSLQGTRQSAALCLIEHAEHFSKNKAFTQEFKNRMEATAIADEAIRWDEGHLEIPYFVNIADAFKRITLKTANDEQRFQAMCNEHSKLVETMTRMDILYKERLLSSEWFIMIMLSIMILLCVIFIDTSEAFAGIIVIIVPAVIVLAFIILYQLDRLTMRRDLITLEPNQVIFDAIGRKRFYLSTSLQFLTKKIADYRTEKDLDGDLKDIYLRIRNTRI